MITIVACIKYINSKILSTDAELNGSYVINPYDLYMLEQLLKFKKEFSCRIFGLTMGPLECIEAIQRSIAYGLDDIFLVSDKCFSGSDTYATSYILTGALKYIGPADVYAFGEKAVDGETGQVPIGIASRLDLLCIIGVQNFHLDSADKIYLERKFADKIEELKIPMPCVLGFQGFTIKEPQVSLLNLKQARSYTPIVLTADSLNVKKHYCGYQGSRTAVKEAKFTISKRNREVLEGTPKNKAEILKKLITETSSPFRC